MEPDPLKIGTEIQIALYLLKYGALEDGPKGVALGGATGAAVCAVPPLAA
jgi:hypothetical protein